MTDQAQQQHPESNSHMLSHGGIDTHRYSFIGNLLGVQQEAKDTLKKYMTPKKCKSSVVRRAVG
jgi:hypothetical protein